MGRLDIDNEVAMVIGTEIVLIVLIRGTMPQKCRSKGNNNNTTNMQNYHDLSGFELTI